MNHLLHYFAKTLGAVLPLLGGEGWGEDGRPTIFGFMGCPLELWPKAHLANQHAHPQWHERVAASGNRVTAPVGNPSVVP
jgi:hypothetical protein